MTAVAEDVVWEGAEALRPFLVPVDSLEPFPGNPRRGDVEVVRESLRRFGQTRPILSDGGRIVAGHHVRIAAQAEGWTHVAAIPNEFESEEEARAFLLADNRTHDRGYYDLDELYANLQALYAAEVPLAGTGYDDSYLDDLRRSIETRDRQAQAPESFPPLDPDDLKIEHRCPSCGYEWSGNPAPGTPPSGE